MDGATEQSFFNSSYDYNILRYYRQRKKIP